MPRYCPTLIRPIVAIFSICFAASPVAASPLFTQVVAFGDSLTDTGNDYILTSGADPPSSYGYYHGRFSNGPIWLDGLATKLGVTDPAPSLLGGTNYTYGGASSGVAPQDAPSHAPPGYNPLFVQPPLPNQLHVINYIPNMQTQVQTYLNHAGVADPHALYVVWAGANDLLDGQSNPAIPAANDIAAIHSLVAAGAKTVLVANLFPLGDTPYGLSLGPTSSAVLNSRTSSFNAVLAMDLAGVQSSNAGVTIDFLDMSALFNAITSNPSAYGFTDTSSDALQLILNIHSIDPNTYLFWDGVHFTAPVHALIADAAFDAVVPEPGSLTLLGIGAVGIVSVGYRRRRRRTTANSYCMPV